MNDVVWDDLIIGAGSSGAVVASRLSEDSGRSVLLLEAGPDFQSTGMPVALREASTPQLSEFNWNYTASPGENRPPIPYPLGKVTGGSSSINGTIALQGLPGDFERWAELGNSEWGWDSVAPFFRRMERSGEASIPEQGPSRGIPITLSRPGLWREYQNAFYGSCRALGLRHVDNFNSNDFEGVGAVPTSTEGNTRISTATAYLDPARKRSNLEIRSGHRATKIRLSEGRAVGVEVINLLGVPEFIRARRITLSAGAINSPALLERSGIGDAPRLLAAGVKPLIHLPGVGENLADHPAVILWLKPSAIHDQDRIANHQVMARIASTSEAKADQDLNIFMLSDVRTDTVPLLERALDSPVAAGISVVLTDPRSRGRSHISAAVVDPKIDLHLLSDPQDLYRLMEGVRFGWEIARSHPIARMTKSIFMWTEAVIRNDALLAAAVKRTVHSAWHPVGTAKMGESSDDFAVTDQHFRVHGISNLRVVDASVMPVIPRAATNLTCIMLGERAAAWMKEESRINRGS